jgi:hypothetical protein
MVDFDKLRFEAVIQQVELAENFTVKLGRDTIVLPYENRALEGGVPVPGRFYYQIECYRKDAITGEMGMGYGGKAYLSEHMTDSELVQTIFGIYKSYWEHEARETFQWNGRRVFGPHIATEALWEIARRVDVRSAKHEEDQN